MVLIWSSYFNPFHLSALLCPNKTQIQIPERYFWLPKKYSHEYRAIIYCPYKEIFLSKKNNENIIKKCVNGVMVRLYFDWISDSPNVITRWEPDALKYDSHWPRPGGGIWGAAELKLILFRWISLKSHRTGRTELWICKGGFKVCRAAEAAGVMGVVFNKHGWIFLLSMVITVLNVLH